MSISDGNIQTRMNVVNPDTHRQAVPYLNFRHRGDVVSTTRYLLLALVVFRGIWFHELAVVCVFVLGTSFCDIPS